MEQKIIDSLVAKYNAELMSARTNLHNYLLNPVGVGEHPDIVSECDKLIEACATAEGKLESLRKFVDSIKQQPNPIISGNESSDNRK